MFLRKFLIQKTHKLVITIAVVVGFLTIGSLPFFSLIASKMKPSRPAPWALALNSALSWA